MAGFEPALLDAAAVAGVALLGVAARRLWRVTRGLSQMIGDWRGDPSRPGVPARLGVMEQLGSFDSRLQTIEGEISQNGGRSLRDSVARIHEATTGQPDPGVRR